MVTTTLEYWSVIPSDGVEYPLQTYAKNIESWGDDRQTPVPLRGSDVRIPWIPGEQETERVADARTMTLAMWVRGVDDNNAVASTSQLVFRQNWMLLKRILKNRGKILTLRKRFYDEAGTLRQADARARWAGGMSPAMLGMTGAKFTVDFRLADPFFYGAATTVALTSGTTATPTILGDAECRKVSFTGAAGGAGASDVSLADTESNHTFSIIKALVASATVVLDFQGQSARFAGVNVAPSVNHVGSTDWFRLTPGLNHLIPSSASGGWSGTLTYYPTWN
jgi:hypothetical protein